MKKIVYIIVAIIVVCCGVIYIHNKNKKDPKNATETERKKADPLAADMILINLANAMKIHSAATGGGGHAKFADDLSKVTQFSANKIKSALPGAEQTSFDGYIVCLEENPKGDNFATNFLLVAYPAEGYEGDVFTIDKSGKVKKVETK